MGARGAGAGTIVDVTSCPGTDTCKLGIAASRGLGSELRARLAAKSASLPQAIEDLSIKISGCFNSCGQHHIADIGFYGNSRKIDGRTVPHFQVILGGQRSENAGSYGLAVGSVPSKAIPQTIDALTDAYGPEHPLVASLRTVPIYTGPKGSQAELEALHEQSMKLADILCQWNQSSEPVQKSNIQVT